MSGGKNMFGMGEDSGPVPIQDHGGQKPGIQAGAIDSGFTQAPGGGGA